MGYIGEIFELVSCDIESSTLLNMVVVGIMGNQVEHCSSFSVMFHNPKLDLDLSRKKKVKRKKKSNL